VVRIRSLLHFMLLQSLPALSASGPCLCQTGGLPRTIGARDLYVFNAAVREKFLNSAWSGDPFPRTGR
jgi:hypothetical protein